MSRPLKILFLMWRPRHARYFQASIELLADRGHEIHLVLEKGGAGEIEQSWLDRMLRRPNFHSEIVDRLRADPRHRRAFLLRSGMEYVHFRGPGYASRPRHLRKALSRPHPGLIRRIADLPLVRTETGLRALYGLLSRLERTLPVPAEPAKHIARLRPDVVVLGSSGNRGSLHTLYLRAAKSLGIPTLTCVASWDHLTTRPPMRELPDLLAVWNERQLREAIEIHGVPAGRVVVTGAPNFDDWFAWQPRPREEFLVKVGLDPERPAILWVGSSLNRWERTEAEYVAEWLQALRSAGDPVLDEASVLLRPHPYWVEEWLGVDFSRFANVALWPRGAAGLPVEAEQKADFYDSIFHSAAVVGINTSAMIEAAIVGRPVLTVLEPDFHDSQLGAFHFSYLVESSGGAVRVADGLGEHFAQLRAILAGEDAEAAERARRFVAGFVRPHGLDRPAAPVFADAVEALAATVVAPAPGSRRTAAAGGAIAAAYRAYDLIVAAPGRVRHFAVAWVPAAVRVGTRRLRSLVRPGPAGPPG